MKTLVSVEDEDDVPNSDNENVRLASIDVFRDQIEADEAASKLLLECIPQDRHYSIEYYDLEQRGLSVDGRVTCLWSGMTLMAQTIVVRDDANNSVLTCIDLRVPK